MKSVHKTLNILYDQIKQSMQGFTIRIQISGVDVKIKYRLERNYLLRGVHYSGEVPGAEGINAFIMSESIISPKIKTVFLIFNPKDYIFVISSLIGSI